MSGISTQDLLLQIDQLLAEYDRLRSRSKYTDLSDLRDESNTIAVRLRAGIERLAPGSNSYMRELIAVEGRRTHERIRVYIGILRALKEDVANGWTKGLAELLHADTFGDLLDQAMQLHEKGYKDAAAVISGSALEAHLRLLATRSGVDVSQASGQPKKADLINAELVKAGTYSTLQQKSVTAWLGIRNASAHGEYTKYGESQVAMLIESIRDFILRYPA